MEPKPSVPVAQVPYRIAVATPAPPLDPPGVIVGAHGFKEAPKVGLEPSAFHAASEVFVLPSTIAPARLRRATASASKSGTHSAVRAAPRVVRIPAVAVMSLMVIGTPKPGPIRSGSVIMSR